MTRRAFTLLEVLLSLVLLGAIITALFGFVGSVTDRTRDAQRAADRQAGIDAAMDAIDRALATTFVEGPGGTPGVTGSASEITVLQRMAVPGEGEEHRRVHVSFGGSQLQASLGQGSDEVIASDVGLLRFRFHDGTGWREEFESSRAGTLPAAVEVAVWMVAPEAGEEPGPPDRKRLITVPDGPVVRGGAP